MSYEQANRIKYTSGGILDFGTAGEVFAFKGPKGKTGRIYDYGIEGITETFTNTTTGALVSVGSVADADLYADELNMGTQAVDTGTRSLRTIHSDADIAAGAVLLDATLPADTIFALHCVAPTGGTPAGMAIAFVIVDWSD